MLFARGKSPVTAGKLTFRARGPAIASHFAFYAFLVLLGMCGAFTCLSMPFSLPLNYPAIFMVGGLFSLGFAALFFFARRLVLLSSIAGGIWLILGLFSYQQVVQGLQLLANEFLVAYSEKFNYPLALFQQEPFPSTMEEPLATGAALYVLVPLAWLMALWLVRQKSYFLPFFVSGICLTVPLAISVVPASFPFLSLLTFWAMLLFLSCSHVREGSVGIRRRVLNAENAAGVSRLLVCVIFLSAVFTVAALLPQEQYRRDGAADTARNFILEGGDLPSLLGFGGVGTAFQRVNLGATGNRSYTGKTMLRVKTDSRIPTYLKGFVGTEYTGYSWELMNREDEKKFQEISSEQNPLFFPYELKKRGFYNSIMVTETGSANPQMSIEIQHKMAGNFSVFAPFLPDPVEPPFYSYQADAFFKPAGWFGEKNYKWDATVKLYPMDLLYMLLGNYLTTTDDPEWAYEETLALADTMGAAMLKDENGNNVGMLPSSKGEQPDLSLLPEGFLTPEEEALFETVKDYSAFVQEVYTKVPEALRDTLKNYIDTHFTWSRLDIGLRTENILQELTDHLTQNFTYTLNPGDTPYGTDFVSYFLLENQQGYCVHFASAATLLLRSAGIPARYAEGYVASPGSGDWEDLPDSRAHAWVEVYYGGTGWVPVDMTPGLQFSNPDMPTEFQGSSITRQERVDSTPGPRATITPSPSPSPLPADQNFGGTGGRQGLPLWAVLLLCIVGGVVAIIALLWGNRLFWTALRKRRCNQEDLSKAGLALYAHMTRLYRLTGRFHCYRLISMPTQITFLAEKARFSRNPLTPEEWERMRHHAAYLEQELNDSNQRFFLFLYHFVIPLL